MFQCLFFGHMFHMSKYQISSQKWSKEGVLRPEIAKGGGLRLRKRYKYAPERCFVNILAKMAKKFGPIGGGVLTPISPPLGYAPGRHSQSMGKQTFACHSNVNSMLTVSAVRMYPLNSETVWIAFCIVFHNHLKHEGLGNMLGHWSH